MHAFACGRSTFCHTVEASSLVLVTGTLSTESLTSLRWSNPQATSRGDKQLLSLMMCANREAVTPTWTHPVRGLRLTHDV